MSALEAVMTTTAESGLADRALAASAVLAEAGRAPIVVMATLKGGSGKSTAAACLSAHCQRAGLRVAIIDADPQASLLHWASLGEPAMDIDIVADTSETVGARARARAREAAVSPISPSFPSRRRRSTSPRPWKPHASSRRSMRRTNGSSGRWPIAFC
jgi:Mrp family chromosome partitioning ATPase